MPGPQRINPIGNEWNPPAAMFGPTAAPPAPPPPPPAENVLFWARFEQVQNRDEVGNWIYVLDAWVDPGDTFSIDTTVGGEPSSPIGSLRKDTEVGRRLYIQAADNETGGVTPLSTAAQFNAWSGFEYSIWFRLPAAAQTDINLGGFNAGGGDGQAIFSLNFYWFGGAPEIEARIADDAGAFYLSAPAPGLSNATWYRVRLRRTGDLFELLLGDTVLDSITRAGVTFATMDLINFAVDKDYSGTTRGWIDEPKLTYTP